MAMLTRQSRPLKTDPSRTGLLARRFATDLRSRYSEIAKALAALLVTEDALGLRQRSPYLVTHGGAGSGNFGHAGRPGEVGGSAPYSIETVDAPDAGEVRIHVNPTKEQFKNLIDKFGDVRVMVHPHTGDVLVWESAKAIHDQIGAAYGFVGRTWRDYSANDIFQFIGPSDKVWEKPWDKILDKWWTDVKERAAYRRANAKPVDNRLTTNTRWKFDSKPNQVRSFEKWLQVQFEQRFPASAEQRWNEYVSRAFTSGVQRSYRPINYATGEKPEYYQGSKDQFIRSVMRESQTVDRVRLLADRTYTDIEGVNQRLANDLRKSLIDGLMNRQSPSTIARAMSEDLGIARKAAERIARTELVRAQAQGQLVALSRMGATHVGVAVEWITAGDAKVCPKCEAMEGHIFAIEKAWGLIPKHPNCRCAFNPVEADEDSDY